MQRKTMTFNANHQRNIKINENKIENTKINKIKQKTLDKSVIIDRKRKSTQIKQETMRI